MSQITPEEMQKRGELLKRAREILVQEFTAIRNQQHQQWVHNSANAWKTKSILIAYPSVRMFPTEQEIVNKALELFNMSNKPIVNAPNIPTETSSTPPIQVTDNESPMLYQDALTPSITEQLQAVYNAPVERIVIQEPIVQEEPKVEEPAVKHSLLRSVLSGWLAKEKDKP